MAPQDAIFAATNRIADDAAERMLAILDAVSDEIADLMDEIDPLKVADRDRAELRNLTLVRKQVQAVLTREGIAAATDVAEDMAADMAAEIAGILHMGDFDADATRELERILRGQTREIEKTFGEAAREIGRAIDAGQLTSGKALRQATEEVAQKLRTSFVRASTAVEAAIAGTSRAAVVSLAEGAEAETGQEFVFLYSGPADSHTRPFCREHVGKAYTRARLDADGRAAGVKPQPASVFAGGYACRHSLAPLLVEDAEEEGIEIVR